MAFLLAPKSIFDPPSLLYSILRQPIKSILRFLNIALSFFRSKRKIPSDPIHVVCISDSHTLKAPLPDGDLLIHAGDLTNAGTPEEIQAQIDWLDSQPHTHKVTIAGNHDTFLDPRSRATLSAANQNGILKWKNVKYLQHSSVTLRFSTHGQRSLIIYGAPQIPACGGKEFAFQYERGTDAWTETVPDDTDVLVTHTPPKRHLDLPAALGCEHLLAECWRVQPTLHVFGHVHAGRTDFFGSVAGGHERVAWNAAQRTLEKGLNRRDGFVRGVLDPRGYLDIVMLLWHGFAGLIWGWGWGGECRETLMVNAALMYNNTGELRNPPQIVEL